MKTVSFEKEFEDVEVKFNEEFIFCDIFLTVEAKAYVDENYGADIDGNRGIKTVLIENIDFVQVSAIPYDENGNKKEVVQIDFEQIRTIDARQIFDSIKEEAIQRILSDSQQRKF